MVSWHWRVVLVAKSFRQYKFFCIQFYLNFTILRNSYDYTEMDGVVIRLFENANFYQKC